MDVRERRQGQSLEYQNHQRSVLSNFKTSDQSPTTVCIGGSRRRQPAARVPRGAAGRDAVRRAHGPDEQLGARGTDGPVAALLGRGGAPLPGSCRRGQSCHRGGALHRSALCRLVPQILWGGALW